MVLASTNLRFHRFWSAFKGCNDDAGAYLRPDWLPDISFRAGYGVRSVFILDTLTTNLVETENRHLKNGLFNRSTILQVFSSDFNRVNSLKQNSELRAAKDAIVGFRACRTMVWLEPFLCRITRDFVTPYLHPQRH